MIQEGNSSIESIVATNVCKMALVVAWHHDTPFKTDFPSIRNLHIRVVLNVPDTNVYNDKTRQYQDIQIMNKNVSMKHDMACMRS